MHEDSQSNGGQKELVKEEAMAKHACEVFLLRLKANGKELDPKFFDEKEKASFEESDRAEWQSWVDNELVQLVPRARHVTCRGTSFSGAAALAKGLTKHIAKSRVVIPGHLDPGLGEFRTDSPTTTPADPEDLGGVKKMECQHGTPLRQGHGERGPHQRS